MCGEYGEKGDRPHYHAILFGVDFHDRYKLRTQNGIEYYASKLIDERWGMGDTQIGEANFDTAAYCARYITKKLNGKRAHEYGNRMPEYQRPSRGGKGIDGNNMGGIGSQWINKYWNDIYPNDEVQVNGKTLPPPKYYDSKYEIIPGNRLEEIKKQRQKNAEGRKTPTRTELMNLRRYAKSKMKELKRGYENGT